MKTLPALLGDREIRSVRHDGEWWFAMEDVAAALTEGPDPPGAWQRVKEQEMAACGVDLSELCRWLEMEPVTFGHGFQVEAATMEGIFRIVQAISSPQAEIFKRWLARVAAEPATPRGYRTKLDTVFAMPEDAACSAIANRLDDRATRREGIAWMPPGKRRGLSVMYANNWRRKQREKL